MPSLFRRTLIAVLVLISLRLTGLEFQQRSNAKLLTREIY